MPKSDNPHAIRLRESLTAHSGVETAARIMEALPLPKSADYIKKFDWAEKVCAALEAEFDADTVRAIRMDCACGPETGKINKLKAVFEKSVDMADFAAKANVLQQGFTIRYERGALFLVYPECYCSCVKRVDKPISASWCDCTLGYTKRMFSNVLSRGVAVSLVESVKTGGKQCIIRITTAS